MKTKVIATSVAALAATCVWARPTAATLEYSYREWSPESYSSLGLTVRVNSSRSTRAFNRLEYGGGGYGTTQYEFGFLTDKVTSVGFGANSVRVEATGTWHYFDEITGPRHWQGVAIVEADVLGFRLLGTTSNGVIQELTQGFWGWHYEGDSEYGWQSNGKLFLR